MSHAKPPSAISGPRQRSGRVVIQKIHATMAAVPKVHRQNLPPALLHHLLERIQRRTIPATQLELLATWLDTEPDVPKGQWYKRFSGMTVCGEGELLKLPSPRSTREG